MSVCDGNGFDLSKEKYIHRYINTQVDIKGTIPFGFTSSIDREGKTKIYTYGKRNIEENLPFEADSIYRMASQSKFMGVVGFLKMVDNTTVELTDLLKDYIPEYSKENMSVIQPYNPKGYRHILENSITLDNGKILIYHPMHPFKPGDYISLQWNNGPLEQAKLSLPDYDDISAYDIYNIHKIETVDKNSYVINFPNNNNTKLLTLEGSVVILKVDSDVHRSVCLKAGKKIVNPIIETYYYKKEPLKRDLTVLDVLTHGLGWSYFSSKFMYMSFGYANNTLVRDIQAGLWCELKIPVGIPSDCYSDGIQEWVKKASQIPLLYQPGEDWSYGPQLSILGSLIEIIDGRNVDNYMKEEIWEPLSMKDTGFFLNENDPDYEDKKNRLCMLYANVPNLILKFLGQEIPFPPIYEIHPCIYEGLQKLKFIDSGMFTTVNDYLKFMKMLLNNGKTDNGIQILSGDMIKLLSTYRGNYNLTNLSSASSYSDSLAIPLFPKHNSEIRREKILQNMSWGIGVGTISGCQNNPYNKPYETLAISWAGILGTRFLIDFCSGIAYNVGTNVVGPPAGIFDSDLIEMIYKELTQNECKYIVKDFLL